MDIIAKVTSGLTNIEMLNSFMDKMNLDSKALLNKVIPLTDLYAMAEDQTVDLDIGPKFGKYYKIPVDSDAALVEYARTFFSDDDYIQASVNDAEGNIVSLVCNENTHTVSALVGGELDQMIDVAFYDDGDLYLRTMIPAISADENEEVTNITEISADMFLSDIAQDITMKDMETALCNELVNGNENVDSIFNKISIDIPAMRDSVLETFQELREIASFSNVGGLIQHLRLGFNSITTGHKDLFNHHKIAFDDTDYSTKSFKVSVSLGKVLSGVTKIIGLICTAIYVPVGLAIDALSSGIELVSNKIIENTHLTSIELNSKCDDGCVATSTLQGVWSLMDQDSPHSLLRALFEGNNYLSFKIKSYGLIWYIWRNEVHDTVDDDTFYYECHLDLSINKNFFDTNLCFKSISKLTFEGYDVDCILYDLPLNVYENDQNMYDYRVAFNDEYNSHVGYYKDFSYMNDSDNMATQISNALSWVLASMLIYRKYEFNMSFPQGVTPFAHYAWWMNTSVDRSYTSYSMASSSSIKTLTETIQEDNPSWEGPISPLYNVMHGMEQLDTVCSNVFTDISYYVCTALRTAGDKTSYTMHQTLYSQDGPTCLFATYFNNDGTITSGGILTFNGDSTATANVYIAQFTTKGKYYIIPPRYTRSSLVVTAVLTTLVIATITIGALVIKSKIKKKIRRNMASNYRRVEQLREKIGSGDPEALKAYDKAVSGYNFKARLFGYSTLGRVDGWQAGADASLPDFSQVYKLITPRWREL